MTYDPWNDEGPLQRPTLDATIVAVQRSLDLLAVLRHRYGRDVEESGERWRTQCFLPSLVPGFVGSCAKQDASDKGGEEPKNLWVSEGDTTRVWRCHSCGRHGDVIDLIEIADNMPRESQAISLRAVRVAAQLAGVTWIMDDRERDDEDDEPDPLVCVSTPSVKPKPRKIVALETARALNFTAMKFFVEQLQSPGGRAAQTELERRGVTSEQVKRYRLGFAPKAWRDLLPRFTESAREDAMLLGLLGRNRTGNFYDKYRERLMFPYCEPPLADRSALISGFAGRTLSDEPDVPKWLNSVNMPGVWTKKSQLWGTYQARALATKYRRAAVTEGAYDTLAFMRALLPAVSLVSASLSDLHCDILANVLHCDQVTIAFDGDATGRSKAVTAALTCLAFGFAQDAVTLVDPGDGNDPDDLTPAQLEAAWREPTSIADFALAFADVLKPPLKIKLVASLAPDDAERLRVAWDISEAVASKQRATTQAKSALGSSPAHRVAAALLADSKLATCFARKTLAETFATDPLAWRSVAHLTFADETHDETLPAPVREAWLMCRLAYCQAEVTSHDATDLGNVDAAYVGKWLARGESLRREVIRAKQELARFGVSE